MQSKADLHVHSKYSDLAGTWYLRIFGFPESVMEPRDIYEICRERGMDFVTISDHDTIDGALEIAGLPGTFISAEITVSFPEDDCKIHCLVTGVSEPQFREIDRRRHDIYDFHRYVTKENVICSVAHPLFQVNDGLAVDHVEKLLLMFERFEGVNGTRDRRAADVFRAVAENLTPQSIRRMQERHGLEPTGVRPWKKVFTGGSDDHGGEFLASAFTVTPAAATVDEYLQHLRAGRHSSGGSHGSSLRLAHSLIAISRGYLEGPIRDGSCADAAEVHSLLSRFLQSPSLPKLDIERDTFRSAAGLCRELVSRWIVDVTNCAGQRRFFDLAGTLPLAATAALAHAPFLAAFSTQHKDNRLVRDVADHFQVAPRRPPTRVRKLWATDTLSDVNGVAKTIQSVCDVARRRGCTLRVMTSQAEPPAADLDIKNFAPIVEFPLPLYADQKLGVPPLLEVAEYIEREEISEVVVSTPGPVGLVAAFAARLLGIPVRGIYHTDFPAYVGELTGHSRLEEITSGLMRRLYSACDEVLAPSQCYRSRLEDMGVDPRKLRLMPRGVDTNHFHPNRRQEGFWNRYGLDERIVFLYVGRVSKEKNIELLLDEFRELREQVDSAGLAIVGDGPERERLQDRYRHPSIAFTGFLRGQRLATAYASADVFVFPSTTDTFGNAVLEAQASGLPAIVSDRGGPAEIVERHESGFVVDVAQPGALSAAMYDFIAQPWLRCELRERAVRNAAGRSWEAVFNILWHHERAEDELPEELPGFLERSGIPNARVTNKAEVA